MEGFETFLQNTFCELFDETVPFYLGEDSRFCVYCPYPDICMTKKR